MEFFLAKEGRPLRLGEIVGKGGEGTVYAIDGTADRVAKIYADPPTSDKSRKLARMCDSPTPSLERISAWPLDLIKDSKNTLRGFVMSRKAARRDVHELYSPKSRATAFPEADFRFIVQVAANITRAFAAIHDQGHVIGDVNHGNLLVGTDATVVFIDCDSFQINSGEIVFTSDVGSAIFTPPELQGKSFRGLRRTRNHDLFGLGVLLFHLFYMGRHPFAGRFLGTGDMPIEIAIAQYRFAYGPDRSLHRMDRPPGTVPLEAMGAKVAANFVQAFSRNGAEKSRPDARAWLAAIIDLQEGLRSCAVANWHYYLGKTAECPWCAIESQTGARLFGQRVQGPAPGEFINLDALWSAIAAVPGPGLGPPLPSDQPWTLPAGTLLPSSNANNFRRIVSICIICGGVAGCVPLAKHGGFFLALLAFGLAFAVWPREANEEKRRADSNCSVARADWEKALEQWRREASQDAFNAKLRVLDEKRAMVTNLAAERTRGLAELAGQREKKQKIKYLDRFKIEVGKIKGIGPSRVSMLSSFGIETAADIERSKVVSIPGFGASLLGELMTWRNFHEKNFRPNPNEPIDPSEINQLDQKLNARRASLIAELRAGPKELVQVRSEIMAARLRLMPILIAKWDALKLAELTRAALGS